MSIVTVTTTTVVVLTTTTAGHIAILGVGGTCALIIALIAKELFSSASEEVSQRASLMDAIKTLDSSLGIVIIPMIISFAMVVAMKVVEVLQ
ncbi:MAG: hypothetical protein AEth_01422 [Candidatus Argoarchaeum ethanivorans]|uniref:Uncharacterized protein n=1 Tax=Candidatus Argoarchaeum ethanivorans TaxID=2608793 RepID=A0A8B3S103_9EURY|nr:MAG: hypothetical protein AEth_01422 [Candidatus Argoarchaeum ethanivorans]